VDEFGAWMYKIEHFIYLFCIYWCKCSNYTKKQNNLTTYHRQIKTLH